MVAPYQERPPRYVSRAELAGQLSISEASVDEMVNRGVLPNPAKQSSRGPRWSWKAVERALALEPYLRT
jgi:predicted DNA-binding transcriptional regulator AlpA